MASENSGGNVYSNYGAAYGNLVDSVSLAAEKKNGSHIRKLRYEHEGITFYAKSSEPYHLRSYIAELIDEKQNTRKVRVRYPKILYVHGLACDGSFFDDQAAEMAQLGIASKAITLPKIEGLKNNPEALFEWQVGAVCTLADSMNSDGSDVVIVGHSRGAQVAANAARELLERGSTAVSGLVMQGPAISEAIRAKSIPEGLARAAIAGINTVRHDPVHGLRSVSSIVRNALDKPRQTISEAQQPLHMSIRTILLEDLGVIPIRIAYSSKDEFAPDMYEYAISVMEEAFEDANRPYPISIVDLHNTNHMLRLPAGLYREAGSLADPRLHSGDMLQFLQSIIDDYSPPLVRRNVAGHFMMHRDSIHK